MIATTTDDRQYQYVAKALSICTLSSHIAISGCRSLSQSFKATFFELMVIENLTVVVLNDYIICFLLKHVGVFFVFIYL